MHLHFNWKCSSMCIVPLEQIKTQNVKHVAEDEWGGKWNTCVSSTLLHETERRFRNSNHWYTVIGLNNRNTSRYLQQTAAAKTITTKTLWPSWMWTCRRTVWVIWLPVPMNWHGGVYLSGATLQLPLYLPACYLSFFSHLPCCPPPW